MTDCQSASKNGVHLTDTQKTKCVNIIVDYGISVFGLNPQPQQYELLAFAAVDLVNGLKSNSGSPIVRIKLTNRIPRFLFILI